MIAAASLHVYTKNCISFEIVFGIVIQYCPQLTYALMPWPIDLLAFLATVCYGSTSTLQLIVLLRSAIPRRWRQSLLKQMSIFFLAFTCVYVSSKQEQGMRCFK